MIDRSIYTFKRRFIIGTGSRGWGGWEVPDLLPTSWRTKKASGVIPFQSWTLRTRGSRCPEAWELAAPVLRPKCWKRRSSQLRKRQRELVGPSGAFLFPLGTQWAGWCPPTLVSTYLFTQSTESKGDLFQKHPHQHAQQSWFTSFLGIPQPSQADISKWIITEAPP